MAMELPKQYEAKDAQARWYRFWEERGDFDADPNPDGPPHTIMIPLPNVTGALHMGHALNGTVQDLITRWRRMQGYEALWMPGTDHAGIATQAVVERRMLEEEGLTRHDIGREALVNRIWRWKDAYEQRILNQLKQLGASCDWRRTRFTLDDVCSRAVRRTFFKLFRDGLIYRGKRLVNWDTHLQTAVADDEVYTEDLPGSFWTFSYPVVDENGETGETIAFSTTRPETMLGDAAVCVHPSDERYQHLVGKRVRIPLNGREIPIIADALLADKELGTGAVKVTPAHDPNDYACYQRHPEIGAINLLNPDGTLNENAGPYAGMDRYAAREQVVAAMQRAGHFVRIEERTIPLKYSDRSKTPIEPYLSDQWFVKMDDLAQRAIDAVADKRVRFFPSRYDKTYLDWLGEKRDWCISRQLWWGHRIPIWIRTEDRGCHEEGEGVVGELSITVSGDKVTFNGPNGDHVYGRFVDNDKYPEFRDLLVCVDNGNPDIEKELENAEFRQDPDVLDTWFSSALWPHATLGWPDTEHNPPLSGDGTRSVQDVRSHAERGNEVLDYFYPGNVLVTSRDIITLWVARMVLTGLYNMGDVPFRHVCIHPKILDGFGQTMSKSKGNGVDPMDLIDRYGTDAVRFTIASFAGENQDVRLPVGYECPSCQNVVPQKQLPAANVTYVVPETLEGAFPLGGGEKPRMKCPQCKTVSQFSSPLFEPDPDVPAARVVSERFEYGRNFCNKLWNAARFALLNLEGYTPAPVDEADLKLEDRWILSRLSTVTAELTTYLGRYQFDIATRTLREFTWNEFCDWYLEMIKPRLRDSSPQADGSAVASDAEGVGLGGETRAVAQRVLVGVLDALIRLLQPFTPFIAEELWQRLKEIAPQRGLLQPLPAAEAAIVAPWPELPKGWQDAALEKRFERLQETIIAVRNVRAVYGIPPQTPIQLHMRCNTEVARDMQDVASQFDNLAKTLLAAAGADVQRPPGSANFALAEADGYIPLEGLIDRQAELARQKKEADKLRGFIAGHERKLANENFVSKAPPEVVGQVRETLAGLHKQLESTEEVVRQLSQ